MKSLFGDLFRLLNESDGIPIEDILRGERSQFVADSIQADNCFLLIRYKPAAVFYDPALVSDAHTLRRILKFYPINHRLNMIIHFLQARHISRELPAEQLLRVNELQIIQNAIYTLPRPRDSSDVPLHVVDLVNMIFEVIETSLNGLHLFLGLPQPLKMWRGRPLNEQSVFPKRKLEKLLVPSFLGALGRFAFAHKVTVAPLAVIVGKPHLTNGESSCKHSRDSRNQRLEIEDDFSPPISVRLTVSYSRRTKDYGRNKCSQNHKDEKPHQNPLLSFRHRFPRPLLINVSHFSTESGSTRKAGA